LSHRYRNPSPISAVKDVFDGTESRLAIRRAGKRSRTTAAPRYNAALDPTVSAAPTAMSRPPRGGPINSFAAVCVPIRRALALSSRSEPMIVGRTAVAAVSAIVSATPASSAAT
jgi:hypothetical protein